MRKTIALALASSFLRWRRTRRVSRYRETTADSALLVIDADGLKQLNDRYGHLAGDRALCAVAARIGALMPAANVLARYGGDEFVVLAPGLGLTAATLLGRRLREGMAQNHFSAGGHDVAITVSIGIAALSELSEGASVATELFALADGRSYSAKSAGRNFVRARPGPR